MSDNKTLPINQEPPEGFPGKVEDDKYFWYTGNSKTGEWQWEEVSEKAYNAMKNFSEGYKNV